MPPITNKPILHYMVSCARCTKEGEVCPKRDRNDSSVAWLRAVAAFERHGWHQDASSTPKPGQRLSERDLGNGTWYCPECRAQVR